MSNEEKSTKTLWQKINFLNFNIIEIILLLGVFSVLMIIDAVLSTYLTISIFVTMISYLGYPLYVIYKAQKNNQLYPVKKITKIVIINAIVVRLFWLFWGSTSSAAVFVWSGIAYDMMKNRIAIGEEENQETTATVSNDIEKSNKPHISNEIVNPFEMTEQPTLQKQTVKITVKRKSASKKADVSQEQVYSESPITPVVDNEIKFCRKCGAKLEKGSIYCIKCGSKI